MLQRKKRSLYFKSMSRGSKSPALFLCSWIKIAPIPRLVLCRFSSTPYYFSLILSFLNSRNILNSFTSLFISLTRIFKYVCVIARLLCPNIFCNVTTFPPIITHFFANVCRYLCIPVFSTPLLRL